MNDNIKRVLLNNLIWRFLERCGAQAVTLIVTILIARILEPAVYGQVAIITVFITILQAFVDSGLVTALIQKEEYDLTDFSTVFYFNIFVCILIYVLYYFCVPFAASFFNMSELASVMRVSGLVIIVSGIKNVQQAYISKNFMFKKFFFSTLTGTVISGIIGVMMAYNGCGIWALAVQNLSNQVIDTAVLWVTVRWRPAVNVSVKRLKILFSYGWKMLASSLINTAYTELRQMIIGKMYTASDLAYYNQAMRFPKLISDNINASIDSVLFPALSKIQSDKERVKWMTRRAIKVSTYFMMPAMMGIAVCAKPIVLIVLTEKWLPCVPYIRIFCLTNAFYVIHTANLNAIKALGRSDLFLKMEVIKFLAGFLILSVSMWNGVYIMALAGILGSISSQIINAWPNKKLLGYSYLEQMKDVVPQMLLSCFMGMIIFAISFVQINELYVLVLQAAVGVLVYITGSKLMHMDSYEYVVQMVRSCFNRNRGGLV